MEGLILSDRDRENLAAIGGMRNPHISVTKIPKLHRVESVIADILKSASSHPSVIDLLITQWREASYTGSHSIGGEAEGFGGQHTGPKSGGTTTQDFQSKIDPPYARRCSGRGGRHPSTQMRTLWRRGLR